MPFQYCANSWVFGNIPAEELVKRAKRIGLSGLELSGEPGAYDLPELKELLAENGLKAAGISGSAWTPERAMNNPDPAGRALAVAYAKQMVDMAAFLGAGQVLVIPAQLCAPLFKDKKTDWENSVKALRETASYAKKKGIILTLECVNRYESSLVRSLEEGARMAEEIGTGNVALTADTFHMQTEEPDGIAAAIRRAGPEKIRHLHLADNTRDLPGKGSFHWREIMNAIRESGYLGWLSFEPVPPYMDGTSTAGELSPQDLLEREMKESLEMLRRMENQK